MKTKKTEEDEDSRDRQQEDQMQRGQGEAASLTAAMAIIQTGGNSGGDEVGFFARDARPDQKPARTASSAASSKGTRQQADIDTYRLSEYLIHRLATARLTRRHLLR